MPSIESRFDDREASRGHVDDLARRTKPTPNVIIGCNDKVR